VRNASLRDQYRRFGLRPNASVDQINAAFRTLSKDAHPDAGGSVAEFESLQKTRKLLLAAAEITIDLREEQAAEERDPRPVWLPGAFVGLPLGVAVGLTGLLTLNRPLAILGLVAGAAACIVITAAIAVHRVHRRNTADAAIYRSAEAVIELREPHRPSSRARRADAPAAETPGQRAANSFSPVSSSASKRQPKI